MIRRYRPQDSNLDPALGLMCGPHHFVQPGFELHSHDFIEMVIVLQGKGMHLTPYGNYPICAGDVFVIHSDSAHGFAQSQGMDIYNFLFTPAFLEETGRWLKPLAGYHALFVLEPVYRQRHKVRNRLHLSALELKATARLVSSLAGEMSAQQPGFQAMVRAHWQQLLSWLCRAFSAQQQDPNSVSRLAATLAYMEQHYNQPIGLDELAQRACLSKNQLIRVFSQHYGQTPQKYLSQLRLERAKELLSYSNLNITSVALQCGFDDSNYFARSFKQAMGCTPREYAARQRG